MPDPVDSERERVAREALLEITEADSVGDLIGTTVDPDDVVPVRYTSLLTGYPGWHWAVSLAELPGEAPTALEAELMPGEGALLAPEWVPWSDRVDGAAPADGEADDEDDDEDDELDDPDDDLDPDEVDDGLDFETDDDPDTPDDPEADDPEDESAAVTELGVKQQDEPEAEPDEGGPEPPLVTAVKKRWQRKKKGAEGD